MKPTRSSVPLISVFADPQVQATCQGVPVYGYGYTHVLAESPDLLDEVVIQTGNNRPFIKVHPKKSSEIQFNRLGGTSPRMPRTSENDYLPLEPIHLIDGNPDTCWCSKSQSRPDVEPAWIRLDLPIEHTIQCIVLRKRQGGPSRLTDGTSMPLDANAVEIGKGMPASLTIKISQDGLTWKTVFEDYSGDTQETPAFTCKFAPIPAKQIWIIGTNLPRVENWLHSFSIAEVEVVDVKGNNVALATRGTGITVSSTQHTFGQTREEHHWLWSLAANLGIKWIRIGYHDDPVNWHWVEKEKGKLEVDPETDLAIQYLLDRGVDIILALGFGNRLYTQADPTRKLPQLWEWYYENPAPPVTPEALKGWARYVRFMARKYRGKIKVFEIWNEWNIGVYWGAQPSLEHYLAIAHITIPILRKECPEAKIMLGSYAGYFPGMSTWSDQELEKEENESMFLGAIRSLAKDVDIIGYHPFYQTDPDLPRSLSYTADFKAFQSWCDAQGFKGEFCASEWSYGASYPSPTPPNWWGDFVCSEIAKAKYVARLTVTHTALGIGSFFCETWGNNYYAMDLTLMRRTFNADPISPQQPQAAYYVIRNLSTALEDLQPCDIHSQIEGIDSNYERFVMAKPGECIVSVWKKGRALDDCPGTPIQITLPGYWKKVTGYDPLNGVEQELEFTRGKHEICVSGILAKDYPVLIRFVE